MGRGNVHPDGPYEWVYYIDRDYTAVYRKVNAADDDMDDRKLRYWFAPILPKKRVGSTMSAKVSMRKIMT